MPRIARLDSHLVDQIAAGEVVERPASVVKELVENALDAGARAIEVAIDRAGLGLVRVTDDGHGMDEEDARLAVERHATSKLTRFEDLAALVTLGFRGEALPSIASVSRFRLVTRTTGSDVATQVSVEGADGLRLSPTGAAVGTTVEVADLFYNVPARRKFLKSDRTEAALVAEVCLRVALADAGLRLVLKRDGRVAREYLPAKTRLERARRALGEMLEPSEGRRDSLAIEAFLAPPDAARTGAQHLHLFVNGRPVRDRALARSVAFAFGSVIPPGRYPVGVVHLTMPPAEVDVNVHPQKAEVRFARGVDAYDAITRVLARALGTRPFERARSGVGSGLGHASNAETLPLGGPFSRGAHSWEARLGPALAEHVSPAENWLAEEQAPYSAAGEAAHGDATGASGAFVGHGTRIDLAHVAAAESPIAAPNRGAPTRPGTSNPAAAAVSALRALGQIRRTWIVCEGPRGVVILDQHAADERVRYDRLRTQRADRRVERQQLLFPERVELSEPDMALASRAREWLDELGLDVAAVGPASVAVRSVPSLVSRASPTRLLRDALDELGRDGSRAFGDALDTALATMACHAAIRAGDALSLVECQALLDALESIGEFRGHCPHGRPVLFEIDHAELERRVHR